MGPTCSDVTLLHFDLARNFFSTMNENCMAVSSRISVSMVVSSMVSFCIALGYGPSLSYKQKDTYDRLDIYAETVQF